MAYGTLRIIAFSAIFCAAVSGYVASSRTTGNSPVPVPRLPLNLDLQPEERWKSVLDHWNLKQLRAIMLQTIGQFVPKEAEPLVDTLGLVLDDLLPAPYAAEIRGIAKTIGINVGEITCMNMLYDLTAACTSIIAQDSNRTIWHARNLDYSMSDALRNLTAIIDFQSHGKTMYTTTSFVGQVGVFTGMKPNKFTITLNERDKGNQLENFVEILQAVLLKKVKFSSFIIRDALDNDESYGEVLQRIISEQQVSPAYVIIAGVKPGEGAVVTRGREDSLDVWPLDLSSGRWFVLETNYDHWVPPPPDDDRRDPANKAMHAVGQQSIRGSALWDVLSIQPVLNSDTVYTAVMCAARPDVYSSKVRTLPSY